MCVARASICGEVPISIGMTRWNPAVESPDPVIPPSSRENLGHSRLCIFAVATIDGLLEFVVCLPC